MRPGSAGHLDVDLRIRDVPPAQVIVYSAERRRGELIRPPMVLLVAEVMSPGSVTTDRITIGRWSAQPATS